jgi:hypothetical protein
VLIEWELEQTSQKLDSLKFFVDRSEAPTEWVTISQALDADGLNEFVDYTAQLYDLQKAYEYRIRAVEYSPTGEAVQTFTSASASSNEADPDLVGMYITEEHIFKYRYVDGVPVFIYKKKHDGLYCPECWDPVLKRVTKSNCATCYGTGKAEGYYPPIEGWMGFGPQQEVSSVGQQGVFQPDKISGEFTDYPTIRIGDLVREIRSNYIWRVTAMLMPEKNRSVLLQNFQLSAVNRTDVEHRLKYPEDKAVALLAEFEARLKQPEF